MNEENKEWFKVIEIADMLSLSKVSVYNKLKTLDSEILQGLRKKEKGITYFNVKAVNIIKTLFNQEQDIVQDINADVATDTESFNIKEDLDIKDDYINTLKEQLSVKDIQIKELTTALSKSQDLHQNTQVLLKHQQEQPLQLEQHIRELDDKLIKVKENMQERKEKQEPKGFFKKIFNKNK
jgi:hypothetical protein